MTARLISLDYNRPKCDTSLDQLPLIIGSSPDAGICFDEPCVSLYHCRIERSDGRLFVSDMGTVHGTFINGARITEAILMPGDVLAIGLLSFYVQDAPDQEELLAAFEQELLESVAAV